MKARTRPVGPALHNLRESVRLSGETASGDAHPSTREPRPSIELPEAVTRRFRFVEREPPRGGTSPGLHLELPFLPRVSTRRRRARIALATVVVDAPRHERTVKGRLRDSATTSTPTRGMKSVPRPRPTTGAASPSAIYMAREATTDCATNERAGAAGPRRSRVLRSVRGALDTP